MTRFYKFTLFTTAIVDKMNLFTTKVVSTELEKVLSVLYLENTPGCHTTWLYLLVKLKASTSIKIQRGGSLSIILTYYFSQEHIKKYLMPKYATKMLL